MELPFGLTSADIETFGYVLVFFAIAIESTGIPFPGETTLIAASIYAGTTHSLNIVAVIVVAALGAIGGDNLGYTIGRYGGYPLVRRILRVLHLKEPRSPPPSATSNYTAAKPSSSGASSPSCAAGPPSSPASTK